MEDDKLASISALIGSALSELIWRLPEPAQAGTIERSLVVVPNQICNLDQWQGSMLQVLLRAFLTNRVEDVLEAKILLSKSPLQRSPLQA